MSFSPYRIFSPDEQGRKAPPGPGDMVVRTPTETRFYRVGKTHQGELCRQLRIEFGSIKITGTWPVLTVEMEG